jgi:surface antigen
MSRSAARRLAPFLILAVIVAGCQSVGQGIENVGQSIENNPKTTAGAALGAIGAGLIGYAAGGGAAGIIGGALLGGLIGGAIGNHLDQKDKQLAAENAQRTLETARTGNTTIWHNPDNGHSGTFTPTRTYQTSSGQYCRQYTQSIDIDGEQHQAYGTACREPDGSWKIQG